MRMKALFASAAFVAIAALSGCSDSTDARAQAPVEPPPREDISQDMGTLGAAWRQVSSENLLILTTRDGEVVVELNPAFAPGHVKRMRDLVRAKALDGVQFYRVIDGFVAQGGLNEDEPSGNWPALKNENERAIDTNAAFVTLGNDDLFAPEVGHIDGFAVGRNAETGTEWLLHCPGALAMARDTDPDSGTADFYFVLDAQRYLDRNLTVFGRVLSGMQYLQKLQRGDSKIESGFIQPPARPDRILKVTLAADMPETMRPRAEVMKPTSDAFEFDKRGKRVRRDPFFYNTPPAVMDICDYASPSAILSPEATP